MTIKKLDKNLNLCLWVIFGLLTIGCFLYSRSFKAPEFEPVESSVKLPYVYSSEDGERYDSYYTLAWMHKNFKKPQVVAYDPNNGSHTTFKEEYVKEYEAMMPDSEYPFHTRWTLAIFGLLALVAGAVTYIGGGYVRDAILCSKIEQNKKFTDCSYFLFHERIGFKKKVQSFIGDCIGAYINEKSPELYKQYRKDFADLLVNILRDIQKRNTTDISYKLRFANLTTGQQSYLSGLREFWASKIGTEEKAQAYVNDVDRLMTRKYLDIDLRATASSIRLEVDDQMNKIFTDILGEEIFKFHGETYSGYSLVPASDCLYVDIIANNHSNSFTWSGDDIPADTHIPGISVSFNIYHYVDKQETLLKKRVLGPVCDYTATEGLFDKSDLYNSMVIGAIRTARSAMAK